MSRLASAFRDKIARLVKLDYVPFFSVIIVSFEGQQSDRSILKSYQLDARFSRNKFVRFSRNKSYINGLVCAETQRDLDAKIIKLAIRTCF